MFITFEGIDYSGKTTQARLAVERLVSIGARVTYVREPGGTELSERIRAILLEKGQIMIDPVAELLLFSAARAQLVREVIVPLVREGTIVVCDRFYDSTTAYQGYGRDLPLDVVGTINRFSTGGTTPDLTLFVDVGTEEIRRRKLKAGGASDRMERSGDEFYARVSGGYRRIAENEPDRVVIVSGAGTVDETHAGVWKVIAKKLNLPKDTL